MDQKQCIHCSEKIPTQAKKCRYCLEFQVPADKNPFQKIEIIKEVFSLMGKSLIPIVILILAFSFKPTLDILLSKANEVELLGSKFKFSSNSSFVGSLSAYELYYLIDSADHGPDYKGGFNYDMLKKVTPNKLKAIESLEDKGLVTIKITQYDGEYPQYFGQESLATFTTEKGQALLKELGVNF